MEARRSGISGLSRRQFEIITITGNGTTEDRRGAQLIVNLEDPPLSASELTLAMNAAARELGGVFMGDLEVTVSSDDAHEIFILAPMARMEKRGILSLVPKPPPKRA